MASKQRAHGSLGDPREDRDLQAAEDEEVHEAGGDQGVLQVCRDPLPDAEDDAEQHRGVRSGQRRVDGRREPRANRRRDLEQAARPGRDVEADRLELEERIPLREVRAAIEGGQVPAA